MALLMLVLSFSALSFAASDEISVSLRVEGVKECVYYNTVTVEKGATVLDVITTADKNSDKLDVTVIPSDHGPYIYAVNGIIAGSYTAKKWDGWSYMVDGKSPKDDGVSQYTVSNGNSIVLYYADPWNTGMQYPTVNTRSIAFGKISFTSLDTVYDAEGNYSEKECPVTGYTFYFGTDDGTIELQPDENGVCKIPYKYIKEGKHTVQIAKYDEKTGLPTVLRYAPDYTVEVGIIDEFISSILSVIESIISLFVK